MNIENEIFWETSYHHVAETRGVIDRLPEWLNNFKINLDTIGFDLSIEDLPKIKEAVIIVDHPMTGSIEPHLEALKQFKGTLMVCDRALYKIIPYRVPEYTCNLDSSYLCMSFFDRPDVRAVMDQVTAIFSTSAFPLTIRHWQGKRVFFTPFIGSKSITKGLSALSKTPWMHTGGNVATFLWLLAVNLGATNIGLLGFDMSIDKMEQTEYPGLVHKIMTVDFAYRELPHAVYLDPVYKHYAEILHHYIKHANRDLGVQTINLQPDQGILHSEYIDDLTIEEFLNEYR